MTAIGEPDAPPLNPPQTTRPGPASLRSFFEPTGVAVIGASANPRKLSHGVLRNLIGHGFQGNVYPVNPGRREILGLPCYPDIAGVPDPIELAVIILPAALCPEVVDACGRRGLQAAIIISGGFREVGAHGQALEEQVARMALQHGMRLIGPNCVGTIDSHTGLNTTFIRTMPRPGHIAFVSQSGAICGGILEWTASRGVGFSRFATLGNEADVTETDLIEVLAEDPQTRVIVAYLEAIRDGRRFIDVATRVTPHKPILVIKAGTTEAGSRAVSSHTGSLAGTMAAYDAAFAQSGVLRVSTLEELFNSAVALSYGPLPRGNRVVVVTNAGGPASLAADELERCGLAMPRPAEASSLSLAQANHPNAQLSNPIDMLGGAEPANYQTAVETLLDDPNFDAVLPILVPQALVDPVTVAQAIAHAAREKNKPVVSCFMGDEAARAPMAVLHEHQMASYQFPEQAARALGALWWYAAECRNVTKSRSEVSDLKERQRLQSKGGWGGRGSAVGAPRTNYPTGQPANQLIVRELLGRALAAQQTHLGEWESRPVLTAYGVPQPAGGLARTAGEVAEVAAQVGYPVALKIVSPEIFHKSEVGGVVLGLEDEAALVLAYQALLDRVGPGPRVDGVLVAAMAPPGLELIAGMRRDPQFGPLVMFGLGGIYVELVRDVAFRVAPFPRRETRAMISETRAGRLLEGLRGRPPADLDAVVQVIEGIAQLALDFPEIQEIDLNPLIAYEAGKGVLAVDARLVVSMP